MDLNWLLRTNRSGCYTESKLHDPAQGLVIPAMPYKQLPPQRTVGTIGSTWQESTPSKKTTGPAQTRTQSETLWKQTVENAKRRTRGLCLSPRALANWF